VKRTDVPTADAECDDASVVDVLVDAASTAG
jgi:hypothetical protein